MPLNNAQYDAIIRDYQRRQIQHRHEKESRVQEVYAVCPRIREIDEEVASCSVKSARMLLGGNENALADLRDTIEMLGRQRREALEQAGYPADYLDMTYDCPDCKDTGFIENEKCRCFKKAEIDLLYTQSNIRDILEEENFANFSLDYYADTFIDEKTGVSAKEKMRRVLETCQQFVKDFDHTPGNLFLYGNTGVGKTFLSNCIAKELLETTHSVIYFSSQALFDCLAKERFEHGLQEGMPVGHIYDCDLLIIDDLGTEMTNEFVRAELFLCINERLANHKSTIISTNLPLKELTDKYSERVFSRITNHYTLLRIYGEDIRVQKKIQSFSAKNLD